MLAGFVSENLFGFKLATEDKQDGQTYEFLRFHKLMNSTTNSGMHEYICENWVGKQLKFHLHIFMAIWHAYYYPHWDLYLDVFGSGTTERTGAWSNMLNTLMQQASIYGVAAGHELGATKSHVLDIRSHGGDLIITHLSHTVRHFSAGVSLFVLTVFLFTFYVSNKAHYLVMRKSCNSAILYLVKYDAIEVTLLALGVCIAILLEALAAQL
ncbi:hypothetical protein ACJX0J_006003, partial [Zea mays]